jgi:hypothetical protein
MGLGEVVERDGKRFIVTEIYGLEYIKRMFPRGLYVLSPMRDGETAMDLGRKFAGAELEPIPDGH